MSARTDRRYNMPAQFGNLIRILVSYWTAIFAWVVMTVLHLRWLHRSTHAGDVISAYGAGLTVLGLLVAARPFLKMGVDRTARSQVPQLPFAFAAPDTEEGMRPFREHQEAAFRYFRREIIAERVIAVAVVVVGTLLNGWGTPLARRWGLPV